MANPNRLPPPARFLAVNVVGASARAAVFSALRGGATAAAADLFADRDLRAAATATERVADYPSGLVAALERLPPAPFIYTGGLENHPAVVDALARARPLLGNDGATLRRARDPFLLARTLAAAGVPMPEMRRAADPPRPPAGWLVKACRGAGGAGIRRAGAAVAPPPEPHYFQRRVRGIPHAALYLASARGAVLLGATRQLVGTPWLHAPPFAWCGSIGPAPLEAPALAALARAGTAVAAGFGLRGLFGIDFLLAGGPQGCIVPLDLNPRYPASAEVLEHALGFSAVALHAAACANDHPLGGELPGRLAAGAVLGKAVLFAPRGLVATEALASLPLPAPDAFPELADIPDGGTRVRKGKPLLTVFARGATDGECEHGLKAAAAAASRLFRPARHPSYYRAP
jgi:predicted ATP-grasp superfamily ATP-dependent carboligase